MKPETKRSIYKTLDERYRWTLIIWYRKGIFADCTVNSGNCFGSEDEALADLERIKKLMNLI